MPSRQRAAFRPAAGSGGGGGVVGTGGSNIASAIAVTVEESLADAGVDVPDGVLVADAFGDALIAVGDDDFDMADAPEAAVSAGAEDSVLLAEGTESVLDVPEPLLWVTEPPTLKPDVAEFWRASPRLADSILAVGEVLAWDKASETGTLQVDSSNSGYIAHLKQAGPDTVYSTPVVNNGLGATTTSRVRASNSAVNPNAEAIAIGWDVSGCAGVQWGGGTPVRFAATAAANYSTLVAPNITFYAAVLSSASQAFGAKTWNGFASLRSEASSVVAPYEGAVSEDVGAASVLDGSPGYAYPFVNTSALTASSFSAQRKNLWLYLWQDETVLGSSPLYWAGPLQFNVNFTIIG